MTLRRIMDVPLIKMKLSYNGGMSLTILGGALDVEA